MKVFYRVVSLARLICAAAPAAQDVQKKAKPYWAGAMAQAHSKFSGQKGTFAHFGDSITVTLAFWTPLLYSRKNAPPEMEQAYELVKAYMNEQLWRDGKG